MDREIRILQLRMESERVELHKSLVDDIIKGMEEVEQLKASSPSRQRMLTCYQEALFLLTGRDPRGQCHSLISHSDSPSAGSSSLKRKFREDKSLKVATLGQELDDGYEWRKYGQKEILGSKFLRSYYKCTGGKYKRGCSARKQVQRSSIDPTKCEVTYSGKHACIVGAGASAQMREAIGQVLRKNDAVMNIKWESRETISLESVERQEF